MGIFKKVINRFKNIKVEKELVINEDITVRNIADEVILNCDHIANEEQRLNNIYKNVKKFRTRKKLKKRIDKIRSNNGDKTT